MKNIYAHTETHTGNPGYISINEEDANLISVSVRTRGAKIPSVIHVTREQIEHLRAGLDIYLGDRNGSEKPVK